MFPPQPARASYALPMDQETFEVFGALAAFVLLLGVLVTVGIAAARRR